jgi:hypothetical protein
LQLHQAASLPGVAHRLKALNSFQLSGKAADSGRILKVAINNAQLSRDVPEGVSRKGAKAQEERCKHRYEG